ncbi:MAG: sodium ion-translocating decarboxylase, beta subunit [Deltaproteobacteria bacterium]|jgi:oxaloacetate decarboxylase beta subunit|nr:sodium ion-translocating decarboxylase, beta subunit [Deltaproteobacteria bacterium]
MLSLIQTGFGSLLMGLSALTIPNAVMILVGCGLLYLGIKKNYEPLLLVPIGFGAVLVNIPLANMMGPEGLLRQFYDWGVITEVFPCLIFIGIGAMTDFTPLLQNPTILLLGAAGQFGIFLTLLLALGLGFNLLDSVAIGVIGACDGPTSIYVTSKFAPHLLGAVSVAAYCYMSLVPLLQPPIMRLLTTDREKRIKMEYSEKSVSRRVKIIFPIVVTLLTCLIAPMGTALMGTLMLGNLLKESGVVNRLSNASQNEIANAVTLLLGISIGATMDGAAFLRLQTLMILGLGFLAICLDTVTGVLFGKLMCALSRGKINPLLGAAGISAYPMAARVVQTEGRRYDPNNWLLMHAMGANTGGQVGSIMAAALMLSALKGLGLG